MSKRTYRSADAWRSFVHEQQRSGLSARAFCEANALGYASFINWRRRLDEPQTPDRSASASFIELTPATGVASLPVSSSQPPAKQLAPSTPFTIELSLGHGIELRITQVR